MRRLVLIALLLGVARADAAGLLLLGAAVSYQAPTLDGFTSSAVGSGSTIVVSLTTTQANDVVVCEFAQIGGNAITAVSDGSSLTWTQRYNNAGNVGEWWARAPSALSADTITATVNYGAGATYGACFGVNGANTTTPFDPNSGVPSFTAAASTSYSTNVAKDFVVAFYSSSGTATPSAPTGFTQINTSANYFSLTYQRTSAAQSGTTVTGPSAPNWMFVDAIQHP